MPRHFDPHLVSEPFGDPGLYVDLVFERRALLFDLGDLTPLAPRKLLRISDVFVSHRHMDHFIGFDRLLLILLGRETTVALFGPGGFIDAVEHKLRAYSWNLIAGYEGNLTLHVTEMGEDGRLSSARFYGRSAFAREIAAPPAYDPGVLLQEPGFKVRAATLDHAIPSLAFALEERAQINICRNRVEDMGLKIGPWLRSFKDAVLRNETDAFPVAISWAAGVANNQATLPLGTLKQKIMHVTGGRKIVYVVDTAFTPANAEKIVNLASGADILFIEATFLDADRERATARHHLTARQAGTLARQARVKRLATFHHSPRYRDCRSLLVEEAEAAFHGTQVSAVAPAASECRAVTTGQCGDGALPEGDTSVVAGQSSGDENMDSGCSKP